MVWYNCLNVGSANTTKFNVGDDVGEIENVIGAGVTIHSIGSFGDVFMSERTLNAGFLQMQTISLEVHHSSLTT